jgi:hypothetical protein
MASVQASAVSDLFTEDGSSNGRVKLSTTDGFFQSAYCYVGSSTVPSQVCVILGAENDGHLILGKAADIGVRGNNFDLVDTTVYLVADGAYLSQPAQLVDQLPPLGVSGGSAASNGTVPYYVPYGSLIQGNNFNPMTFIASGPAGNILVSDGERWIASASSPDGIQSIQAGDGIEVTNGSSSSPTVAVKNAGYVKAPTGAGPFTAGTPVSLQGGTVVACDANDPTTFPCIGLWTADNHICTSGLLEGLTGLPANTDLFIAKGGGLTDTCPNDADTVEQKVGGSIGTTAVFVSIRNEIYN